VLDYELEAAWPENAAWPRSRLRTISDSKLVVVLFELRRGLSLISAQGWSAATTLGMLI
jgi:hypothetical protein